MFIYVNVDKCFHQNADVSMLYSAIIRCIMPFWFLLSTHEECGNGSSSNQPREWSTNRKVKVDFSLEDMACLNLICLNLRMQNSQSVHRRRKRRLCRLFWFLWKILYIMKQTWHTDVVLWMLEYIRKWKRYENRYINYKIKIHSYWCC